MRPPHFYCGRYFTFSTSVIKKNMFIMVDLLWAIVMFRLINYSVINVDVDAFAADTIGDWCSLLIWDLANKRKQRWWFSFTFDKIVNTEKPNKLTGVNIDQFGTDVGWMLVGWMLHFDSMSVVLWTCETDMAYSWRKSYIGTIPFADGYFKYYFIEWCVRACVRGVFESL